MGWGNPKTSESKWLDEEQRELDRLADEAPAYLMRNAPQEKDAVLMARIEKIMQADGMEGGFCAMHLAEAIFGEKLAWKHQLIGSCVASGDMRTTTYRMLAEIFVYNQAEQLPGVDIDGVDSIPFFAPFNYRAGRSEANISGYSDGSLCVPHIRGKMKRGHLPCSTPNIKSDRYPEPKNQSLYREWGAYNSLCEPHYKTAAKFPLVTSEKVTSADQAKEILCETLAPLNICSSWGFQPDYTHPTWQLADGQKVVIYKRRGTWHHNMSVVGFTTHGNREFVIIENSWPENFHRNGRWFAIPATLFDTWLRQAQCQSVGELDLTDSPPVFPASPSEEKD